MKFGVNTFIWGAAFGPPEFHLLPEIKANGFDGVEVPILDPASFDATAVGRELDRIGLELTAVTIVPEGTSLASSDAGVRQRSHLEAAIAAARDAGAKILAGPMYSPVGYLTRVRRISEEWKWVVDSWQHVAPAVDAAAADASKLCDEIGNPAIGILLDTFHANRPPLRRSHSAASNSCARRYSDDDCARLARTPAS